MLTLSNTPTDYILVRATNDSDWFCSDFAIIQLSSVLPILKTIDEKRALHVLGEISYSMTIYKGDVIFYNSEEEHPEFLYDFVNDETIDRQDFLYVDYDHQRDHNELGELEITQGTASLDVSKFAGVSLTRDSKHTGEECFCYIPDEFIPNFE